MMSPMFCVVSIVIKSKVMMIIVKVSFFIYSGMVLLTKTKYVNTYCFMVLTVFYPKPPLMGDLLKSLFIKHFFFKLIFNLRKQK
jgi:hypothetical protein